MDGSSILVAAGAALLPLVSAAASTSWLVYESPAGLVYQGYANQGQANAVNTDPRLFQGGLPGRGRADPVCSGGGHCSAETAGR